MQIQWLGHACFLIKSNNTNIYIDPNFEPYVDYGFLPKADLILISSWSPDHATREGIDKVRNETTAIWGSPDSANQINNCVPLIPGQKQEINDIQVASMKTGLLRTSRRAHSESIGFLINLEKKNVYFAGDTEITELKISPDVLLIPVGGTFTMNARQAFALASQIRPKLIIPMHYGSKEGTVDDAMLFKELIDKDNIAKVKILSKFGEITL